MRRVTHPFEEMISVVVPYFSNRDGLAVTLLLLQQQTLLPDRIIILDSSKDKSGLELARRYRLPGATIIVEVHKGTIYQAWNKGIELAGDTDCLILNDDLLFPLDFVEVLTRVTRLAPDTCLVPDTPPRDHRSPKVTWDEFSWLSAPSQVQQAQWMPGFSFFLPRKLIEQVGTFDETFAVWFGDTDYEKRILDGGGEIVQIEGLRVYHYGSTSYGKVNQRVIQARIRTDRERFKQKYGQED